jgi:hypothetical protein
MTGQVRRTPYNAYNLLTNADLQFPNDQGCHRRRGCTERFGVLSVHAFA